MSSTLTLRSGRIAYLDGIRAVAILLVIAVHWVHPYFPHFPGGYIGVDIFFVLSGFIITRILWRTHSTGGSLHDYRSFILQRVRRLYPALLGFLIGGTLLIGLAGRPTTWLSTIQDAFIAAAQGMSIYKGLGTTAEAPFGHTWSLADEWFFYLLFPLLLMWLARRNLSARAIAWILIALSTALYVGSLPSSGAWFYYGPVSRASEILAGAAAALLLSTRAAGARQLRPMVANSVVIGSLIALVAWTVLGSNERADLYRVVGFPLAVAVGVSLVLAGSLSAQKGAIAFLSSRPMTYLGRVSYSVYLWHLLPMQILDKDVTALSPLLLGIAGVAMTVVASLASYYFLERPFMGAKTGAIKSAGAVVRHMA